MAESKDNTNDSMRDWPLTLKLNAASARLASALYYAKCEVWGSDGRHFDALTPQQKHVWIRRAAEFLKTVQPAPPVRRDYFGAAVAITRQQFAPDDKGAA